MDFTFISAEFWVTIERSSKTNFPCRLFVKVSAVTTARKVRENQCGGSQTVLLRADISGQNTKVGTCSAGMKPQNAQESQKAQKNKLFVPLVTLVPFVIIFPAPGDRRARFLFQSSG